MMYGNGIWWLRRVLYTCTFCFGVVWCISWSFRRFIFIFSFLPYNILPSVVMVCVSVCPYLSMFLCLCLSSCPLTPLFLSFRLCFFSPNVPIVFLCGVMSCLLSLSLLVCVCVCFLHFHWLCFSLFVFLPPSLAHRTYIWFPLSLLFCFIVDVYLLLLRFNHFHYSQIVVYSVWL